MKHGFTLIEVLVAIALFSIMLLVVTGTFTHFILAQRRDSAEQTVEEDVRLALELFAREVRTAYASSFALIPSPDGLAHLVFRDQNGTCVMHRQRGEIWERAELDTSDECDAVTYLNFAPLTSPRTRVENITLRIPDEAITNGQDLLRQGYVTVILRVSSAASPIPPLDVQTTITSRQVSVYGQE